jgi:hypothetical protein
MDYKTKTMDITEICDITEITDMGMEYIHEYDNETQLKMLIKEIKQILAHSFTPPDDWFEERFGFVFTYSELDWTGLINRMMARNPHIAQAAQQVVHRIQALILQWSQGPTFDIILYRDTLIEIQAIWFYYKAMYMGNEKDIDVVELTEMMAHI